jgi:hypothetical protein
LASKSLLISITVLASYSSIIFLTYSYSPSNGSTKSSTFYANNSNKSFKESFPGSFIAEEISKS